MDGHNLSQRPRPQELAEHEDEGLSAPGRWVNSHDLFAGDLLLTQDGRQLRVLSVSQRYEESFAVCNLTIDTNHSFAVGNDGLLVHNTTGCNKWGTNGPIKANADPRKFTDYIFKEGATHGKDKVFRGMGYGKEHSDELLQIWQKQAGEKYARGDYVLGKADQYGQRIDIEIELPGIGDAAGKTSYLKSGWMIQPDGSIKLNTPFSGFTR